MWTYLFPPGVNERRLGCKTLEWILSVNCLHSMNFLKLYVGKVSIQWYQEKLSDYREKIRFHGFIWIERFMMSLNFSGVPPLFFKSFCRALITAMLRWFIHKGKDQHTNCSAFRWEPLLCPWLSYTCSFWLFFLGYGILTHIQAASTDHEWASNVRLFGWDVEMHQFTTAPLVSTFFLVSVSACG